MIFLVERYPVLGQVEAFLLSGWMFVWGLVGMRAGLFMFGEVVAINANLFTFMSCPDAMRDVFFLSRVWLIDVLDLSKWENYIFIYF